MAEQLHPILAKTDDSFNEKELSRYDFAFEISDSLFRYSIRDVEKNKFIALGCYKDHLSDVLNANPWMTQPFHKVNCVIGNAKATLIPEALFIESEKESYFHFLQEKEAGEVVLTDRIEHLGIYTVYGISGICRKDLYKFFPNAGLCHISSVLIENIWMIVKNMTGCQVYLNIRDGQFDLLVFEGKQLKYCNVFKYLTAEDIAYYVIFVFEQLNLNPEEVRMNLTGNTDRFSPLYDLLFRYIRNIEFVGRNGSFNYSYVFNEVPGHAYYSLLNSISCAS